MTDNNGRLSALTQRDGTMPARNGGLHRIQPRRILGCLTALGVLALTAVGLSACNPVSPGDVASAGSVPTSAVKDYNKAQTLQYSGHCDRAIPLYLSAINKNGMYVNAFVGLGSCYQNVGAWNAAILEYDRAIQIDPTQFGLYMDRAGAEVNNGNTGAAISDLNIALTLATQQVPSYNSISDSFASFGDFADAVKALDKSIELVPGDPSLYEKRAGLYQKMQDYPRAYADYQRAIKVAPFAASRANVYADLAGVYDQAQDFNSALGAIATAIRLQPNNASYYLQSGNIHQEIGAFSVALKLYNQALKIGLTGTDAESAHESKGDVLAKLGRSKEAVSEYRQALALTPKTDVFTRPRLQGKIKALEPGGKS